ncbi:MAG: hypothetical protein ACRCRZ_00550 [Metamycoplasmataceae bacterium]
MNIFEKIEIDKTQVNIKSDLMNNKNMVKNLKCANNLITDNEIILIVSESSYKISHKKFRKGVILLTTEKLIFSAKRTIGKELIFLDLKKIEKVGFIDKKINNGFIIFYCNQKQYEFTSLKNNFAHEISQNINMLIKNIKKPL